MNRKYRQSTANAGIITNAPTTDVAWCTGNNVRFGPGYVKKTPGKMLLATLPNNVPVRNMFTFKGYDGILRTLVCSDIQVFSYTSDFTSYIDISPPQPITPFTGNDSWQFSLCGGMPVLSNGIDYIFKWDDYDGKLERMFDGPQSAKAMATINNRVVYGWVVDDNNEFTGRLRWTKIANPELATVDRQSNGGRADLIRPSGGINAHERVKAITSYNRAGRVYTERNIWSIGAHEAPYVFRVDVMEEDIGLMSARSVVTVRGVDFMLGTDDIYKVTDRATPIGFPIKNSLFANLNRDALGSSFAFFKPDTMEVFFCVPTGSATTPNTAFIYNIEVNNFSICDVNYLCHAYAWAETVTTWDDNPFGMWDSINDSVTWDQYDTGIIPYSIVGNINGEILKLDEGMNDYYAGESVAIKATIETGDSVLSTDFHEGEGFVKAVGNIYPFIKPQSLKTALMVEVGVRDSLSNDIIWSNPLPYIIGVSQAVNSRKCGNYVRLRFSTEQLDDLWVLNGYSMDFSYLGRIRSGH